MKNILLIVFTFSIAFASAQSDKTLVRQGNKFYQNDDFTNAEIDYRKALDKNPNSLSGTFNLADAIYEQEDYEKSAEMFAKIGQADLAKDQKGMAYYNLGNSLLKAQQYEPSIEAYKMALRNNPVDAEARYNLEYARMMLKNQQDKQDQNKDQEKKDDKKQDQKKKDDKQDKDDQQDQEKEDKKDQNQDQENQQDNNNDQGKPEQQMNDQQSKQISKKDAERMLEALKNNEKKTLEKLKKGKKKNVRIIKKEKDW